MTSRRVLTDDERFNYWRASLETSYSDTIRFFWNRKLFRSITAMFQANEALRASGRHVWNWLVELYSREALMALRRELDTQHGTIGLRQVLLDMETHPKVLTRSRYQQFYRDSPNFNPEDAARFADRDFEGFGGPPGPGSEDDHIPAAVIKADREIFDAATAEVLEYAHRWVAHRTPRGEVALTLGQIDEAVRAFLQVFRKYYLLGTGKALTIATPVPQFDWLRPFEIPWLPADFHEPEDDEGIAEL